jgi:hypothetical protein
MNKLQLRQKIESQLDQLSPERLVQVSEFIDTIAIQPVNSSPLRKLSPIRRGKTVKNLLEFANTWQGNDLEDCLNFVRETRSYTEF